MVVINIDTAKDSPDEIRKTIRYLQALVGDEASVPSAQPSPSASPGQPAAPAEFGGMEIFKDETQPDQPSGGSEEPSTDGPERSDAERLLKEAGDEADTETEIEVEDSKDAFIEIVDLDDDP